jgi:hypothetical protein
LFGGRAFGGASSQQLAVVLPGRKLCTGHADAVLVLFLHRVRSALVSPFRCVFSPAAVVTTLRVLSALVSPFRGFRFSFPARPPLLCSFESFLGSPFWLSFVTTFLSSEFCAHLGGGFSLVRG